MRKPIIFCFVLVVLCCPAIAQQAKFPMIEVINTCVDVVENKKHPDTLNIPDNRVFNAIASCTKHIYTTNGNTPDSPDVKNFYVLLDDIVEDYNSEKITLKKAKAELIRAWSVTIDASNARQSAARANTPQVQSQPGVAVNPWERAHQILKGMDAATNQRYLDRQCYSWCLGQGISTDQCTGRCSR